MQRLSHDYIDTKFIACFLEFYKIPKEKVELRSDGRIGNLLLSQLVERVYLQFMRSNQDYDNWFDRQIIECQVEQLTKSKRGFDMNLILSHLIHNEIL